MAETLAAINRVGWVVCVASSGAAMIFVLLVMSLLSGLTRRVEPDLLGFAAIMAAQGVVGVAAMRAQGKWDRVIPALSLLPIVAAHALLFPFLPINAHGLARWTAGAFAVVAVISVVRLALVREPE